MNDNVIYACRVSKFNAQYHYDDVQITHSGDHQYLPWMIVSRLIFF